MTASWSWRRNSLGCALMVHLPVRADDLRDGEARTLFQEAVVVDEAPAEAVGEKLTHRGLSGPRKTDKKDAFKCIAGYCVINDVSEREYQIVIRNDVRVRAKARACRDNFVRQINGLDVSHVQISSRKKPANRADRIEQTYAA